MKLLNYLVRTLGLFAILVSGMSNSFAQNSVVVVPMGSDGPTAGVNFIQELGAPADISISPTWASIHSLGIAHPASGFVTCIAMGHVDYDSTDSGLVYLGWHIEDGSAQPPGYNYTRAVPPASEDRRIQLSAMHTFEVSGRGVTNFFLKSRTSSASATVFDFSFHSLVCMYFPAHYAPPE